MEELFGAAVNAAGSIGSNIMNAADSFLARRWQEQMWQKQNEYNLPINQVSRLKEAGINPNLAFGSAASAMGTSVPSSPSRTHYDNPMDGAVNSYFRNRLERKSVLSQIEARRELTRGEKLKNDAMEALLTDYIDGKSWGYKADAAKGKWFVANNDEWFGKELQGKEFRNDLMRVNKLLVDQKYHMAVRELEHMRAKYNFEDKYYNNWQNPYETSTIAGLVRTIAGLTGNTLFDVDFDGFGQFILDDLKRLFGKKKN